MTQNQIMSLVRDVLLKYLGILLVGKGIFSDATWAWASGGILALIGTAWSLWVTRPTGIVASAAALPDVSKVVTTSAIANGTLGDNAKVTTN